MKKTSKQPKPIVVVRWSLPMYMMMAFVVIVGQVFHPVIWILLSAGAVAGWFIWCGRNWRCPDCGKSLGKVTITSEIACPHCGKKHKL